MRRDDATDRPRGVSALGLALTALVAVLLGGASAWPLASPARIALALGHSGVLFAAMAVFVLWLPRKLSLPMQIFVAMVAGVATGWVFAALGGGAFVSEYLGIFGTLFVLLLKLVITPLIFVSIVCGVAGIGDVRRLGGLGVKAIGYYMGTTAVAVLIGLTLVNVIQPGGGRETREFLAAETERTEEGEPPSSMGMKIQNDVLPVIISNPVMAGQSPIAVIFFAILLGAALATLGKEGAGALEAFRSLDRAFITVILWVMALAPIGVFALMAGVISELGLSYIITLALYCFTVLLGLTLHLAFLSCVVTPVLAGVSPLRFLRGMVPAFEVAFSTSSSTATLPVTIDCATRSLGADKNISHFMLPIGATINMDGTALYVSVASLFIAQVYGIELGLGQQVMVFLTAVMVSVGTAGIPGASLGLMSIILISAGIPVEGIGIVVGVDRILDMSRTVVNVTGDSVGTLVVSRSEGQLDREKRTGR